METLLESKQILLDALKLQEAFGIEDINKKAKFLIENSMFLKITETHINEIKLSIQLTEMPKEKFKLRFYFGKFINLETNKLHFIYHSEYREINTNNKIDIEIEQHIFGKDDKPFIADTILFATDFPVNSDFIMQTTCLRLTNT